MRLFVAFLALALAASPLSARVILEQNFDDTATFAPGPLADGAAHTPLGSAWHVSKPNTDAFSIVTSPVSSAPHALKVLRRSPGSQTGQGAGFTALRLQPTEGYDFSLECKVNVTTGNGVVLHLVKDGVARPFIGVLLMADTKPKGYTADMGWLEDGSIPPLPSGQWVTCRIDFDCAEKCYRLNIATADGKHAGTVNFPVVIDGLCDEVRFINILPDGCHSFIDDVRAVQSDQPILEGRRLLNANAASAEPSLAAVLAGKDGAAYNVTPKTPVEIEFSPEAEVNALMMHCADGAIPQVSAKALNSLGHWIDLGKLAFDANGFLVMPCPKVVKLALEFAEPATMTEFRIYSPLMAGQGNLDMAFSKKMDAEFRLPVYDRQYPGHERARFTLVNHTDKVFPVVVAMRERGDGRDCGKREVSVPPGRHDIFYDLKGMPDGEYLTTVMDFSEPDSPKHGKLERLLRVRTSPPCTATPRRMVTGQKIFFPDGFYLASHENIEFIPGVAERHLVVHGRPGEDNPWIFYGDNIFIDKDGRVRINYRTMDRKWHTDSIRSYSAVAVDESLDKWETSEGSVPAPPQTRPMNRRLPPEAKPDWGKKPGPDGKIAYRFYDAAKDGPVKLSQVNLDMISPAAPGTIGYQKYDWKVMHPAPCTIWPVWYKAPGEAIILSRTPLVESFPPSGALEPPNSGSDLGFGQWLSDDGKTLFMGHGRHLMRHVPYTARYDNLFDRARIVAVWRTVNGLDWEQNYVAPPSECHPIADQSYGGVHFSVPDGGGLRIAFFNRYSAFTQQISWEIIYSWDGFRWTRFQGKPQFMSNGPLGDFFHGGGYVNLLAVEKDGKFYQLMSWVNDHYHFQSEMVHTNTMTASEITADYVKRRMEPRHLEEWPFFDKYFGCSWEKLAEHTRRATSGVGVAVYRKDGYFSASADAKTAKMLTTPFQADGALNINATVLDGGFLEARLLQNGATLPGYFRRLEPCDGVSIPLFEQLPKGEFQVEIVLRNARVYTLQF